MHFLFDLDGTLTDSRGGLVLCFEYAFAKLGFSSVNLGGMNKFMGMALPEVFREIEPEISQRQIVKGIEAFRFKYEREGIKINVLYPGVVEMLQTIEEYGFRSTIVTSKPQIYADPVVDDLGIRMLLAGVVGANLDETDTKTILIAKTVKNSKYNNRQTVMLGDRNLDIVGALENDVLAVGALWGYGDKQELQKSGCKRFVDSPEEFTEIIVNQFGDSAVGEAIAAAV